MPELPQVLAHPTGVLPSVEAGCIPTDVFVDTYAGRVHVSWDPGAALTPLWQLLFFVEFLKVAGLFDRWVGECPLSYTSPNAPKTRDLLGTTMLSILSGHRRHAHMSALRGDGVLPELLGMTKAASEDSGRSAILAIDDADSAAWLQRHLDDCTRPLLGEPWILDVDTSVKLLYGHQEGAAVGAPTAAPAKARRDLTSSLMPHPTG